MEDGWQRAQQGIAGLFGLVIHELVGAASWIRGAQGKYKYKINGLAMCAMQILQASKQATTRIRVCRNKQPMPCTGSEQAWMSANNNSRHTLHTCLRPESNRQT